MTTTPPLVLLPNALHPRDRLEERIVAGAALAVTDTFAVCVVDEPGIVVGVGYVPEAAITGAATHHRKVSVINKGRDGLGIAVVAELAFALGIDAVAFDEKALIMNTSGEARNVAAGDVLVFVTEAVGNGMVDPGGLVKIALARGQYAPDPEIQ